MDFDCFMNGIMWCVCVFIFAVVIFVDFGVCFGFVFFVGGARQRCIGKDTMRPRNLHYKSREQRA